MTVGHSGNGDGNSNAIGVFDSGIGGLSVLDALRAELPHEDFVYFADAGHAPYGERDEAHVVARSVAVAQELVLQHGIKALVVACNTATAAAIQVLRESYPSLPLVGVEPALKPAVAMTRTRRIAVLATRGTTTSRKFETLRESLSGQAEFVVVACDGLAAAIERDDAPTISALCARYVGEAGMFGTQAGEIDTLVLGCTHYPFVAEELRRHTGTEVRFIDTGAPVAQHTRRLLSAAGLLNSRTAPGSILLVGSGDKAALDAAATRWLRTPSPTAEIAA
ncbi:glutamate racemase [Variovorax sp. RHLX14]|uniref:glutamate racemase n=1 Tax=Variovorax sp. RHLX14 TaxID=1259731 RepID=UPI003F45993C